MKEKDYSLSVDVNVIKDDKSAVKRWHFPKIFGHPISDNPDPIEFDNSILCNE
jgi:hypothetical protein